MELTLQQIKECSRVRHLCAETCCCSSRALFCIAFAQHRKQYACIRKCGHPKVYGLSCVIWWLQKSKGSAESALSGSIDRSKRSEKEGCLQRVFNKAIWQLVWLQNSYIFLCEQQNELKPIISFMMKGYIYTYIYIHIYIHIRIALQGYAKSWRGRTAVSKYLNIMRWCRVIDLIIVEL